MQTFVVQCSPEIKSDEMVSVYLKPDSREIISAFFKKRGKTNDAKIVCIGNKLNDKETYVFQPLFGERAAFRMKGIIETKEGDIVGVGRVSTMVGEIKIDDYEVCLPIQAPNSSNSLQVLLDLPTRLNRTGAKQKTYWQGRIPPGKVGDRKYPALGANYIGLPHDMQIVLEGYICSDKHVDDKGNCLFDRATIDTAVPNVIAPIISLSSTNASTKNESTKEDAKEEKEECAVCKYIKSGPCKENFLVWESCIAQKSDEEIQQCFSLTVEMMRCFKQHEHYDIMTAGTDFSKFDAATTADNDKRNSKENDVVLNSVEVE